MIKKRIQLLSFWIGLLLFTSCYEDQEGCLDVNALNFDVTADIDCGDCCSYPTIRVEFVHRIDSVSFQLDSTYENNLNQSFQINSIQYYLHDFILTDDSGENISIQEKTELPIYENGMILTDSISNNLTLVNRTTIRQELGSFSWPAFYPNFEFSMGLSEEMDKVLADSVDVDHPLGPQTDTMFIDTDNGYYFLKMEITDENGNTYLIQNKEVNASIEIDFNTEIGRGGEVILPLVVDYKIWLEDVDFNIMSKEQIEDKIVNNVASSFSLFE